jgi:hypothetical protein
MWMFPVQQSLPRKQKFYRKWGNRLFSQIAALLQQFYLLLLLFSTVKASAVRKCKVCFNPANYDIGYLKKPRNMTGLDDDASIRCQGLMMI